MEKKIKAIEDLSLNAWPSHQMQLYDGWILRFSYFYTHRTNCVDQIGSSSIPIRDKIEYCEGIYDRWNTPAVFKISPLIDRAFDHMLSEQGYQIAHTTDVLTMDLETFEDKHMFDIIRSKSKKQLPSEAVFLQNHISDEWIQALFRLKGMHNPMHRQIVPSMYRAIPKDTIAACITCDGQIKATGLGILDREYIGLYAIHVDTAFRQKHWGLALCNAIINEGIRQGATKAYLQVVSDNDPAKRLYESLGFSHFYTYWFRQKSLT